MLQVSFDDTKLMLDNERMLNTEAIALKKFTGLSFLQVLEGVSAGDPEAQTALVWLTRRRHGETDLKLSDVVFDVVSFDFNQVDEQGRVFWTRKADGERVYVDGPAGPPDPTTPAISTPEVT